MAKQKVTRKAVSKQPTEKSSTGEYPRHEFFEAQGRMFERYWLDKKATTSDVLQEVSSDMYRARSILEGIYLGMEATHIQGGGAPLFEEQKDKVLLGIANTLELVSDFMGERLERAGESYTEALPRRKKERQP